MQTALSNTDIKRVKQILSLLVENVSCIECCEYYMVPDTASCGHTLCHLCWRKRRTCPFCASPVNRQATKSNLPLQESTEHCHVLCDIAEALLDIKIDDFVLLKPGEVQSENCPIKNVDEWLGRSQNHFSVPVLNSESLSQEELHIANKELSTSEVQIHIPTEKTRCPTNTVHTSIPQDDWDKIEQIPETYEITTNKENIIGPMDIEPFNIHDKEYSTINPRRSSRNKELKKNPTTEESLVDIPISKDSNCITDKMSCNVKQNWNNIKRMRKEFSKLNKKNKNKLNVSIEMCKKTHNLGNKLNVDLPINANELICEIDDNTQNDANLNTLQVIDKEVNKSEYKVSVDLMEDNISDRNKPLTLSNTYTNKTTSQVMDDHSTRKKDNGNFSEKEQIPLSRSISSETNNQDSSLKHNKIHFFKKGILYSNHEKYAPNLDTSNLYIDADSVDSNGDIDISIKIGNTLTNIFVKQKKADVQVKMNTDREIQTSLGPHHMIQTNSTLYSNKMNAQNMQMNDKGKNNAKPEILNNDNNKHDKDMQGLSNKSFSIKKNTASTDTATAHLEITESVEKELSTVMECENNRCSLNNVKNTTNTLQTKLAPMSTLHDVDAEMIHSNDVDIFGSGTMREKNVELLKDSEYASSEILMPTIQTKSKTQDNAEKREREINSDDDDIDEHIQKKKIKVDTKKFDISNNTADCNKSNNVEDPVNYDELMNQVFANIDADIDDIQQSQSNKDKNGNSNIKNVTDINVVNSQNSINTLPTRSQSNLKDNNERNSENLFSMIEKDHDVLGINSKVPTKFLETIKEVLTPVACHIENSGECSLQDMENLDDGSDKYVVEDTPQKKQTLLKTKQKNDATEETVDHSRERTAVNVTKKENITSHNQSLESRKSSKNNTVIDLATKREILETPLTINKFVNHIMHKSTPVARKSLSFENKNVANDAEETLCPTAESVAKNTQEKEFMYRAFENSQETMYKPFKMNTNDITNKKLCVAGSCLNSDELRKLKYLCSERKWLYVDKYVSDITHLVVAVDDQKKCQRSVKYMRALAAGKWIVSYEWVKICMVVKKIVDESQFEALDYTGEPGPKRSRITKRKLFEGIKFFCMPPFSVLDVDSLKGLLEDAGGVVVDEVKKVQVTDGTKMPCILLAEPENTQEDQFIYLAMKLNIVPVNFEWALNCLGSYTLGPIQELLLCPSSLLPKATSKWPASLFSCDVD